jgi:hypothetical protein
MPQCHSSRNKNFLEEEVSLSVLRLQGWLGLIGHYTKSCCIQQIHRLYASRFVESCADWPESIRGLGFSVASD